ncbi:MAG: T9SS type A sorting domain-containing protein [Bacteroidota bacterium]
MKKFYISLVVIMLLSLSVENLKAQLQNIPCTGYNQDVVADGIATSIASTSIDCDGAGYVFVDGTFNPGSGVCATSSVWPADLSISSLITSGLTYKLQPASTKNDLLLWDAVTDSLIVASPVAASNLYVLYTSGGAAGTLAVTVRFTDANTQVFTGVSTTNWCSGSSPATAVFNRTARSTSTTCSVSTCQYMYEINLAISSANQGKPIASITFTNSNGCVFHAFAVGGNVVGPCTSPANQPTALVLTAGSATISGSFTASLGTPGADHYLVVRSTSATLTASPTAATTYTTGTLLGGGTVVAYQTGTTFTDNGPLTSGIHYYYFVFAANSNCLNGPVYLSTSPLTGNAIITHDVLVSSIIAPTGSVATNSTQTVTIRIKNNGSANETSFLVAYKVNSLTPVSENWSGALAHGDSVSYSFLTTLVAPAGANFTLCAYTKLTTDLDTANDKTCKTISLTNVGINENVTSANVKISPNPAKDNLTIEINSNKEQRLEILNLIGQTVYTSTLTKKATINTSAFANGVYILKLSTDKESVVRKFVKE